MRHVRQLLQLLGLALALAWVPISSHCSWEALVDGDLFKCSPDSERSDCSSEGDSCVTVESPGYKVPKVTPDVPTPVFGLVLFQLPTLATLPCRQTSPPTAAPIEHDAGWQFAARTALPPRAPSPLS